MSDPIDKSLPVFLAFRHFFVQLNTKTDGLFLILKNIF